MFVLLLFMLIDGGGKDNNIGDIYIITELIWLARSLWLLLVWKKNDLNINKVCNEFTFLLVFLRKHSFIFSYYISITSLSLVLANPPPPINNNEFKPIEDSIIFALSKNKDIQENKTLNMIVVIVKY